MTNQLIPPLEASKVWGILRDDSIKLDDLLRILRVKKLVKYTNSASLSAYMKRHGMPISWLDCLIKHFGRFDEAKRDKLKLFKEGLPPIYS